MKLERMFVIRFIGFLVGLVAGCLIIFNADDLSLLSWLLMLMGLSVVFAGCWVMIYCDPKPKSTRVVIRKSRRFNRWIVDADKPWWYRCRVRTWEQAQKEAHYRALFRRGALRRQ